MSASSHAESSGNSGPHQAIPAADNRERFTEELFDTLWERYRKRVEYVTRYEQVIQQAGASFVNDHIAFRTFAGQTPLTGISVISRIFEALGYRPAGCYEFPDKHLNAIHYQHPNSEFPKIFISELKTWELSASVCDAIQRSIASHRDPISAETLSRLDSLVKSPDSDRAGLLETVVRQFHELSWDVPEKEAVTAINEESQYAAWVLVHGYHVNHFTSLVNSHQVESMDDIEKTVQALQDVGVPTKKNIEGERGTKLRQSATEAVVIDVAVQEGGQETTMPWTYAYFELAERGTVTDPVSGKEVRFEGFLGPQATHLFEMTKL